MPSNYAFGSQYGAMGNRYMNALRQEDVAGLGAEEEYRRRAYSFDPSAELDRFARGAYGRIFEGRGGVRDLLRDLSGSAVGAGRLDTGFYDEDRGEIVGRGLESLNAAIAGQAMNAAGMRLRNIEDIGQYGAQTRNRYLDLLTGGLDRAQAEINARRRRRSALWGALGSGLGAGAGFLLGGPAGVRPGSEIGGALGGSFGY